MDWKEEKARTIETVQYALDELRHLQRGLSSYLRDYSVNPESDGNAAKALFRINEALDLATGYYDSLTQEDRDL